MISMFKPIPIRVLMLCVFAAASCGAHAQEALYTVSGGKVFVSDDDGGVWTLLAELPGSIRDHTQFLVNPTDPNHLLVGTEDWIWYSKDRGESWQQSAGAIEGDGEAAWNFVSGLLAVETDSEVRFYATGPLRDVYFSDDGETWTAFEHFFRYPVELIAAPDSPERLFVLGDEGLVYRSEDAGASWEVVFSPESPRWFNVYALSVHPEAAHHVVAGGRIDTANAAIFISEDGGDSWTPALDFVADTAVVDVRFDPADPRTLYAVIRSMPSYGMDSEWPLYVSHDSGATWKPMENVPKDSGLRLHVSEGGDTLVLFGHQSIWRSEDHGNTWLVSELPTTSAEPEPEPAPEQQPESGSGAASGFLLLLLAAARCASRSRLRSDV